MSENPWLPKAIKLVRKLAGPAESQAEQIANAMAEAAAFGAQTSLVVELEEKIAADEEFAVQGEKYRRELKAENAALRQRIEAAVKFIGEGDELEDYQAVLRILRGEEPS